MPAGWRNVICEYWPDLPAIERGSRGAIATVATLSPDMPDPTQAQLAQIEQRFAMDGGVAQARVVGKFWFGPIVLTLEQQQALAGLPVPAPKES